MKSGGRLTLVLLLSVAVHVLPWTLWRAVGQQAAGGAGQEAITLVAAPESLGEIVERWQEPVEMQHQVAPPRTPPVMFPSPVSPRAFQAPGFAPVKPVMKAATLDAAPQLDTRPPASPRPKPVTKPKATPKPKAASTSRQAEKAKGTAQAAEQGNRGKAKVSTGNNAREVSLLRQWGGAIRSRIERQKRRASGVGKVRLRVAVFRSGKLASVRVITSSGLKILDDAAVAAAKRARLPKAPSGVSQGPHAFNLPLRYER